MQGRIVCHLVVTAATAIGLSGCGTLQSTDPANTGTVVESTTAPTSSSTSVAPVTTSADSTTASQLAALDAAEQQWSSMGITDYRFTMVNNCFCMPAYVGPILVVVVGGTVASMTLGPDAQDPAWAGSTVPAETAGMVAGTAEALFAVIRDRIGQKDFRAEYDDATGFPIEFYSDPIPEAADDEYGFRTAAFEAT
jgi:uncharacterized protein YceK